MNHFLQEQQFFSCRLRLKILHWQNKYDETYYYIDYCAYWESFEAVPLDKQTGQNMGQ